MVLIRDVEAGIPTGVPFRLRQNLTAIRRLRQLECLPEAAAMPAQDSMYNHV